MFNNKGISILEVLIAATVSVMVVLGLITILNQMNKEFRYANQRADALEFRNSVTGLLSNLETCSCQLNQNLELINMTDVTPQAALALIKNSCAADASTFVEADTPIPGLSSNLKISKIEIKDIEPLTTAENYRGRINFSFSSDGLVRPLRDFSLELRFTTDPATAASSKKFKECKVVGSSTSSPSLAGLCPDGQFMIGFSEGAVQCSAVSIDGGVSNASEDLDVTKPGPGCEGISCITADYGPCFGIDCVTNGKKCSGTGCTACAEGASCGGIDCCAGPGCKRCKIVKKIATAPP